MKLKLYTIPVSLYCAKLRILLRHKNLQWQELPPPGGYGSAEYQKTVPSGNLPAMFEGDFLLSDSEAIAEYLNDIHPSPDMLGSNPQDRAKIRERSRFHDTRLEPELRKLFPIVYTSTRDNELALKQAENISVKLQQLDTLLVTTDDSALDFLSLGDCGFPVSFAWIESLEDHLDIKIEWPENVRAYKNRIRNYPAISTELNEYMPKLKDYLESCKSS